MNSEYLPSREAARLISNTFTDNEVNNCLSICHTSWITSGSKSNFIFENVPTKVILFLFGYSEVNSTWLTTSELANQRARKVLFSCLVCTNIVYSIDSRAAQSNSVYVRVLKIPIVLADGVSKFFFFARVALVSAGKNIIFHYNLHFFFIRRRRSEYCR